MKRFALLQLKNNANKVMADCKAFTIKGAISQFNNIEGLPILNEHGYAKVEDMTFCVAEYFDPFHTLP